MEFEGDAFISYAHLDNVELVEGRKGWVANLHRALELRVAQLLGKSPRIWRDPKLQGNDVFAETLIDRLHHVALLVSVVSPRYVRSEWTLRELAEFWTAAEEQGGIRVGGKARIFKVLKTPVPLDRIPSELRTVLGYEFFRVDQETGKVHELDEVFGPEAQRDFWIKLDDLAHDVCRLLERLEPAEAEAEAEAPSGAVSASGRAEQEAVFLAETTSDLREEREIIKRDLQHHGYAVLPDRPLPPVASEVRELLREDLARCRLSIHLIGRHYSLVPEGGRESLVEIQNEQAIEREAQGGFSRLLWIPHGLQPSDERQRAIIDRLRLDPKMPKGSDLLESYLEDVRTAIQDMLARPSVPAPEPGPPDLAGDLPRLYLICEERDAERMSAWVDGLFKEEIEVIRSVFDPGADIREYHEEMLASCDGVLILYGAGNECWLRRKLREIQKSAGYGRTKPKPAVAIALLPPRTPEKEGFRTHEATVVPQWEGFSPAPLAPFVARLKSSGGRQED
jgi:hypothetical protein